MRNRWVHFTLFCWFILSSLLQYNDPDPYFWSLLYGVVAFICYRGFRKLSVPSWVVIGAWCCFVGSIGWLAIHSKEWLYSDAETLFEAGGLILSGCTLQYEVWAWKVASQGEVIA